MNISLPEELKQYVEGQTRAGYSTPSEYIRELIRDDQKRRSQERLGQLLDELSGGGNGAAGAKFWVDLKNALHTIEARKKPKRRR